MGDSDIHDVEMRLLMIDELAPNEKECNILISIKDVGGWVLKLRRNGNIFNNKDLILIDGVRFDGTLTFHSVSYFYQVMMSAQSLVEAISQGRAEFVGQQDILSMLSTKFSKAHDTGHENTAVPIRSVRLTSQDNVQPIKSGWLLKKRDIMSGWKCRYFELFAGRLDYYSDQYSMQPRGSISLVGANVLPVKPIKVKRVKDYSGISIEAKNPDKLIRLASERRGLEGIVDANGWYQAFQLAARGTDSLHPTADRILKTNPPQHSSVRFTSLGTNLPLSRDDEDVLGRKQLLLCVIVMVGMCLLVNYAFLYLAWMSTKIYAAFMVALSVVVIIFTQEYLTPLEENHLNRLQSKQPLKRAISQMVYSWKKSSKKREESAQEGQKPAKGDGFSAQTTASSTATAVPVAAAAAPSSGKGDGSSRSKGLHRGHPNNTSMIVHCDQEAEDEDEEESEAEDDDDDDELEDEDDVVLGEDQQDAVGKPIAKEQAR